MGGVRRNAARFKFDVSAAGHIGAEIAEAFCGNVFLENRLTFLAGGKTIAQDSSLGLNLRCGDSREKLFAHKRKSRENRARSRRCKFRIAQATAKAGRPAGAGECISPRFGMSQKTCVCECPFNSRAKNYGRFMPNFIRRGPVRFRFCARSGVRRCVMISSGF